MTRHCHDMSLSLCQSWCITSMMCQVMMCHCHETSLSWCITVRSWQVTSVSKSLQCHVTGMMHHCHDMSRLWHAIHVTVMTCHFSCYCHNMLMSWQVTDMTHNMSVPWYSHDTWVAWHVMSLSWHFAVMLEQDMLLSCHLVSLSCHWY